MIRTKEISPPESKAIQSTFPAFAGTQAIAPAAN